MRAVTVDIACVVSLILAFAGPAGAQSATSDDLPVTAHADAPTPTGAPTLRVSGWIRMSVEVSPPARERPDAPGRLVAPHDGLVGRQLLHMRGRYARGSIEAAGSTLVAMDLFHPNGPDSRAQGLQHHARVELRDAYIGIHRRTFDLRAGMQRIAWGHGDLLSPNDVLNAAELRDPFTNETELRHAPTLAARLDVPVPGGALQIVSEPIMQRDRYDTYGRNWSFIQSGAPRGYLGLLQLLDTVPNAGRDIGDTLLTTPHRPRGLSGAQTGWRLDLRATRFDVSQYYHHGYHGTPAFTIDPRALATLDAIEWTALSSGPQASPPSSLALFGAIGSSWVRRHHVGVDIATTAGPWVLHLDSAYQDPALFYDTRFNAWLSPVLETAGGVEYQTGSLDRALLVEARYRHIVEAPPDHGLLFAQRNALDTALLARWTWKALRFEARASVGVHPRSVILRPHVSWKGLGATFRAGVLALGGAPHSFGGWYQNNRSIFLTVRRDY